MQKKTIIGHCGITGYYNGLLHWENMGIAKGISRILGDLDISRGGKDRNLQGTPGRDGSL